MSVRSNSDWRRIQELGVLEHVETLEIYEFEVEGGIEAALNHIEQQPKQIPCFEDIEDLHYVVFKDVHPWAGYCRKFGEMVIVEGKMGCESPRIEVELRMLEKQTEELLQKASTTEQKMLAVAFYHARFERIHPFLDGNGRVGRILAESQLNALFGLKARMDLPRDEYMIGLKRAQAGDLRPLLNVFLRRDGFSQTLGPAIEPHFKISPRLMTDLSESILSLDAELKRSRKIIQSLIL